jgi:hypothetical protein
LGLGTAGEPVPFDVNSHPEVNSKPEDLSVLNEDAAAFSITL